MKQQSIKGILHALSAMAGRRDNTDAIKNFEKEVLLIVGENDSITPIEMFNQMDKLILKITLDVIPNVGHLSNIEKPLKFNQVLLNWIKYNF